MGSRPPTELALQDEAQAFKEQLTPSTILEQDTIESGVELIDRIEREVVAALSATTPLDRALMLIGRHHGVDAR